MPPIESKLGNKTLHSQTREAVNNVDSFIKSEAAAGHALVPLKKSTRESSKGNRSFGRKFTENSE
jgi:hypothetical protein